MSTDKILGPQFVRFSVVVLLLDALLFGPLVLVSSGRSRRSRLFVFSSLHVSSYPRLLILVPSFSGDEERGSKRERRGRTEEREWEGAEKEGGTRIHR